MTQPIFQLLTTTAMNTRQVNNLSKRFLNAISLEEERVNTSNEDRNSLFNEEKGIAKTQEGCSKHGPFRKVYFPVKKLDECSVCAKERGSGNVQLKLCKLCGEVSA